MIRNFGLSVIALALAASLSVGCTTKVGDSEKQKSYMKELAEWKAKSDAPKAERVRITDMPQSGERIDLDKHRWLTSKRITLPVPKVGSGISAEALAQMLRSKGINIMSSLPLDGYNYNGFGVTNVDGETALRLLFAPMGLDYDINDEGQYVAIVPSRSKTFYLKLGEVKTKYVSGSMTGNVGGSGSSSSGGSSGGSTGGQAGGATGGTTGAGGIVTGLDTGKGEVTIDGDFWANIKTDLAALLTQCVPTYTAPAVSVGTSMPALPADMMSGGPGGPGAMPTFMQQPAPAAPITSGSDSLCKNQALGTFSVNPSVGAITVQAPHWVMIDISNYMKTIQSDHAVTMVYEGMLIAVTTSREKSEGIDLQGFASFANGTLGMVVNNNALGGVTVSPAAPGQLPVVTPGGQTVANSYFGIQKLTGNPAQAFLAYLEANGEFTVKQKPRVAVTNGIPGEFGQYDTVYYNQVSQNASSGSTGSSSVGTTNTLVPFKVGSLLRIVPYFDSTTGYVNSPITFTQSVQTGEYQTTQFITASDGTTQQIPSTIPLIRDSNYAGQVRMKDGDMIILGGQVSEKSENTGSGLPGYNEDGNPLSGLMGVKNHSDNVSTYYLALTLHINR